MNKTLKDLSKYNKKAKKNPHFGPRPKFSWPGDLLLGDQMYHFIHLTLRLFSTPTVADVIDYLVYYTTYPKTTNFCCVIIEGANKMAGKGQITSERARKR